MSSEPSPAAGSLLLLLVAVAVLGLGPLFFLLSRRWRWLLPFVDGLVLASVGALAALFVLPDAVREVGLWALIAAGAGLLLPSFVEEVSTRRRLVHGISIALALAGLLVHTLTDGVALVTASVDDRALVLAVILHRIPVGLAAWWIVRPLYGLVGAWTVLAIEGLGTVVGFFLGGTGVLAFEGEALALLQAFVAGALLHVVLHRSPTNGHSHGGWHISETLGALAGAALVALVPHRHNGQGANGHEGHGHHEPVDEHVAGPHGLEVDLVGGGYGERFLSIALDVAPFLLTGTLIATALVLVLPRAPLEGGPRASRFALALRGTAFGLSLPACADGVLSTYAHLRARGVPLVAALAFLFATPVLGVESLLFSLPLLGGGLTGARLVGGVVLAILLGLLVSRLARVEKTAKEPAPSSAAAPQTLPPRSAFATLRLAMREVLDESAAWILLGLAVAAAVEPGSWSEWLSRLPAGSDVLLAALVAAPVYVNAAGATPLAAALVLAGASPGAALAFLLISPAVSVTTLGVLARVHGRMASAAYAALVVGGAVALAWGLNALVPSLQGASVGSLVHEGGAGVLKTGALLVLAALYGAALLRQGPRRFLGGVLSSEHSHGDEGLPHEHDHSHPHHHHHHHHHHHDEHAHQRPS